MALSESRVCVGAVLGAHGVRGEVRIKSFTRRPQDVASFGPVETEDGARRFTVKVTRQVKDGVAASLSGISDRDAAQALKGCRLYVPRSALPELPEEDEYYLADLIGLAVRWTDGPQTDGPQEEGKVIAVHNFGAGDLIEIELAAPDAGPEPQTLMLPFERDVVTQVNVAEGYMTVLLPQEAVKEDEE